MRKIQNLLFLAVLGLMLGGPLIIQPVHAATVTATYLGYETGTKAVNGALEGAYDLAVNGVALKNGAICITYNNEVPSSHTWSAVWNDPASGNGYWGMDNAKYGALTWLYTQYQAHQDQQASIAEAMQKIADPSASVPTDATAVNWMNLATDGTHSTPIANIKELTANPLNSSQSFLTAVPIPPAAWLFASGLIGLALISRRKKLAHEFMPITA